MSPAGCWLSGDNERKSNFIPTGSKEIKSRIGIIRNSGRSDIVELSRQEEAKFRMERQ